MADVVDAQKQEKNEGEGFVCKRAKPWAAAIS